MEAIKIALERSLNMLTTMGIADIVDILLVAYLFYKAIWFVRRTNSYNLAKGIVIFLIVMLLADLFELKMISFALRKTAELGLIALVILFQPELRRLLEKMGSGFGSARGEMGTEIDSAIAHTVLACSEMSESRTGALIIFERGVKLSLACRGGNKGEIYAQLFHRHRKKVKGAAVNGGGADNVLTGGNNVKYRVEGGRLTGACEHSGHTAFKS